MGLLCPLFFSCQKEMAGKLNASAQAQAPKSIDLKISESRVVLLAGNETHSAISMYWDTTGGSLMRPAKFIVQAAVRGTGFDAPVTLGTFTIPAVTFSVKALNEQMRLLFEPGKASMADIRIVGEYPDNTTVISNVMALEVTTYQPTRTFGPEQIFRIPGNYQSWKVPGAPQLISANEAGVYEGYIRFNCQYPQFLMVKGVNAWDPLATYTDIGGSKIGFNGNFFCLPKGGGTYRLKVNTNTNIWSYTKIESWALAGSAVSGKESTIQLKEEEDGLSWRVTTFLQRGSFRIRANDTDAISFGHNAEATVGVPDYDGAEIKVDKAGTYNVVLDLDDAGNYMYAVQRIN